MLRDTFDGVAERYDAIRPGYLPQTVADLVHLTGLQPGAAVLEIGCGTGQLTVPLAERGMAVTAVELGPALATVARRNLAAHPAARVVGGAFEDVPLPDGAFDLVVAATSYHWLDPAVRVEKPARILRPGGALAVLDTHHIAGGTEPFFRDVQACYERWDPATPPGLRLHTAAEIPVGRPELDVPPRGGAPLFEPAHLRRYEWDADYPTADYLTLLLTYSGHLALPRPRQDGLLGCIGSMLDRRFGGRVTKRYLTELRVARRANRS